MKNTICFAILPKYNSAQKFNNINIGTVYAILKKLSSCTKWTNKLKINF